MSAVVVCKHLRPAVIISFPAGNTFFARNYGKCSGLDFT
jgi:hypothetical protein